MAMYGRPGSSTRKLVFAVTPTWSIVMAHVSITSIANRPWAGTLMFRNRGRLKPK
jgi:hypothetical protein